MKEQLQPYRSFSTSTLFVLFFLLITAILLVAITELRQRDFIANQQRLMSAMTRSTGNEISLLVEKYRNGVNLFAEDNADLLLRLMDDPLDEELFEQLRQRVRRHFPNSFGVTVAAPDGEVLLDDFDGIVGEICVRDLQHFATTRHSYDIFVHPHAEVYHFDMPIMLGLNGIDLAVFFVSFRLDEIARLLLNGSPPNHELMLVNSRDPDLIEVTNQGSRAVLGEHIRLDDERKQAIGMQLPIDGTNWVLLDFPAPGLFVDHRLDLYRQSLLIYLLVLLGSILALRRLKREELYRWQAEQLLVQKNDDLTQSNLQIKQAQDRLIETEKMASLGGLVAGISHEINTPIGIAVTAISTLSEHSRQTRRMLEAEKLKRSDFDQFLETVDKAGNLTESNLLRASKLVQSFNQVAVDQSSERFRRFELCDYLTEVMISLQPEINQTRHNCHIDCREQVEIESYPGAISQVITNLVMNSLQHAFDPTSPGRIDISAWRQQEMAIIEYRDDGRGIDEAHRARIFEPFFTTARNKGGSGLGLSIVYNIVTQVLGGTVELTQPGESGFGLRIEIPLVIAADKIPPTKAEET